MTPIHEPRSVLEELTPQIVLGGIGYALVFFVVLWILGGMR